MPPPPPAIANPIAARGFDAERIVEATDEPSFAPALGLRRIEKGTPVRNAADLSQYVIHIRENVVKNIKKHVAGMPQPRRADAAENAKDFRGWHRNEMQVLTRALEKKYDFAAVGMTSWIGSTITAYLSDESADAIAKDNHVFEVVPMLEEDKAEFSGQWNDYYQGGELISWGKQAIGADDGLTSSNLMYIVDRAAIPHADNSSLLPMSFINGYGNWNDSREHGTFVAGIILAQSNNQFVRGINLGATNVWNVESGMRNPAAFLTAFDWTLLHSEQEGKYGIVNLSSNSSGGFRFDQQYGKLVRRASSRALVVQSAGNNLDDACAYAYSSTVFDFNLYEYTQNRVDGIVVVGGINNDGMRDAPFDNPNYNPFFVHELGSNFGHCVEMWAPSSVWSTSVLGFNNGLGIPGTQTQSIGKGTSFAAPHVAALAARYGDASTTPVQREAYLRARLKNTGHSDDSAYAIRVPSFTAAPTFPVPLRLPVSAIAVSTAVAGTDPWTTQDGLHLTGNYWNAGSTSGYITFDLGYSRNISSIRLIPEQSAPGTVNHQILVANTLGSFQLAKQINELAGNLDPIAHALPPGTNARYIRINSNLPGLSWVSWREVELYGY